MSDERIVEAMARGIACERPQSDRCDPDGRLCKYCLLLARTALAYLRAEGADVYWREKSIVVSAHEYTVCALDDRPVALGQYRLVPVGGDS